MTRWSKKLVSECRNRAFVKFGCMSVSARLALMDLRLSLVVQYYGVEGWHPSTAEQPICSGVAYRIKPSYNPISAHSGRRA